MATQRKIIAMLRDTADVLQQRNLDNAVLLAQMASRQEGELVDHFAELGRRFAGLLKQSPRPKPRRGLCVIKGGAA